MKRHAPLRRLLALAPLLLPLACIGQRARGEDWSGVAAWEDQVAYPPAPTGEVVDTYHGVTVADPYRWLEDPDSDETKAWVSEENDLTFGLLDRIPTRNELHSRIEQLWNYERWSAPVVRGGRLFYRKNDGLQNQSVLYVTDSPEEEGHVLLDPNTFSEDGTVALTDVAPSPDGKVLAYGTSDGGSDWRTWHFLDVDTGAALPDVLTRNKFGGLDWVDGGHEVVYSRFAQPTKGEALRERNLPSEVCLHELGTDEGEDVVLHDRPEEGKSVSATTTESRRAMVVTTVDIASRHDTVDVVSLVGDSRGKGVSLIDGFDAQYSYVGNKGRKFWIQTDLDAPNWRIVEIDLDHRERDHWRELVPEAHEAIRSASAVGGHLVVSYLKDAVTVVRVFDLDGKPVRDVDLPGIGTAGGFQGELDQRVTYYTFTSFTTPAEVWSYDVETGESKLFRRPEVDFDPDRFETTQIFYRSADGTRVPMFIVHLKGLEQDGENPTLLYGYGGFDISLTPFFSVSNLVWLESGGVYALPNIRGGGEYGEAWHEAGTKLHKQNVFDDFIAAAHWLIDQGYTRPSRLAISGGSNGGLLVGACMTQHPELYGACLPAVGVMDMLRYQLFTIGWAWAGDYGTVADPDEFRALLAYSPYHNIRDGVAYPATLVTTADHDDRVVPAHSFKFAARLQAAQSGPAPVLIRIETRAGHGGGKPTSMRIDEAADQLAFLTYALGMDGSPGPVTHVGEEAHAAAASR